MYTQCDYMSIESVRYMCSTPLRTQRVQCYGMKSKNNNRIREFRLKKGISQQVLADAINTSRSQIVALERGTRRLSDYWLNKIGPILDVSASELIEDQAIAEMKDEALRKAFMLWDMVIEKTGKLHMEFEAKFFNELFNIIYAEIRQQGDSTLTSIAAGKIRERMIVDDQIISQSRKSFDTSQSTEG